MAGRDPDRTLSRFHGAHMIVDLDPLAYAYLLAREAAHNAPLGATGGAGGPHIALHRADMAWQAIGCRALAMAPETPASDLVGLAARGQK